MDDRFLENESQRDECSFLALCRDQRVFPLMGRDFGFAASHIVGRGLSQPVTGTCLRLQCDHLGRKTVGAEDATG